MAIKSGVAIDQQLIANATASLFAPDSALKRVVITSVTMYANAATDGVELYIIPSAGSASTTTRVLKKDFAVNERFTVPDLIGRSIEVGDTLQGNDGGNGGTGVNIGLTVTEYSGDS